MPLSYFPIVVRSVGSLRDAETLFAALGDQAQEWLCVAYRGTGNRLLGLRTCDVGKAGWVNLPVRTIARDALVLGAKSVIMAHNHPSESVCPTEADQTVTAYLAKALAGLQVRLVDHLVFAAEDVVSFRTLPLL